ncbi:I78 family peptidase inhibitor [Sphingomonas sp. GlSt437]|uniref:I78 family peptidase inhibitor n=1 Tax=Sphingomonas sp. GlSt437 TaxID=3389970 RepID=UPI003A855A69
MLGRMIIGGALTMALAACASDGTPPPASPPALAMTCKADRVQGLVGTVITDEIAQRAKRRAHATLLRVLPMGAMMTMDYRTDRLNIILRPGRKAMRVTCG